MKLHVIEAGNFKLDGGAMFGVVPKSLWQRTNPADDNNMCDWAMRCMLIESGDRKILIDVGIGNKQPEKFFSHFFLSGETDIEKALSLKDTIGDTLINSVARCCVAVGEGETAMKIQK